ncbi:MAG: CvpA family protein [Dehalococcoidia bacterium]|nr:CvpA family protein [Dehalococcoidia bacterium]
MSIVDLQLWLPLGLGAVWGVRRGLLLGVADLLGLAACVWLAGLGFPLIGPWLGAVAGLPAWAANAAAFVGLLVLSQLLFGLAVMPQVVALRKAALPTFFLRWVDIAGGALPGAAKGLLLVGIVLLALSVWPVFPPARAAIADSPTGAMVLPLVRRVEPHAADLIGRIGLPIPAGLSPTTTTEPIVIPAATRTTVDAVAESEMLALLNAERQRYGLRPLAIDANLQQVARAYSDALFRAGQLTHTLAGAGTPGDRLRAAGVSFNVAGENLAYAPTAPIAHQSLLASPSHRENILSARYTRVGIGVRIGPIGRVFTQVFAD